ncbi:MAG: cell division protein ZapA [Bacteroidetes bacterium]|jgi:cell division protein ZapA|nr:cell division protein ZapA [Bacteroidota bacterium]
MISIKIQVGNRSYPLSVPEERQHSIQQAADAINQRIAEYQSKYAVKDMQDLLAMTLLEYVLKLSAGQESNPLASVGDESLNQELLDLERFIGKFLEDR